MNDKSKPEKSAAICFTDGASRGNPGRGGWGAIVSYSGRVQEFGGFAPQTTNNRMELQALIGALRAVKKSDTYSAIIATDSSYVAKGATSWLAGWKEKHWRTKTGEQVANSDQWNEVSDMLVDISAKFVMVSGHVGTPGNERCDEIATKFADGEKIDLYDGPAADYPIAIVTEDGKPNVAFDAAAHKAKKKSSKHSNAKAYSYVSMVDGKIETHATWAECEKRVKGVRGTKYRKAISKIDEELLIAEWRKK
jgi:ribonuclease HI